MSIVISYHCLLPGRTRCQLLKFSLSCSIICFFIYSLCSLWWKILFNIFPFHDSSVIPVSAWGQAETSKLLEAWLVWGEGFCIKWGRGNYPPQWSLFVIYPGDEITSPLNQLIADTHDLSSYFNCLFLLLRWFCMVDMTLGRSVKVFSALTFWGFL